MKKLAVPIVAAIAATALAATTGFGHEGGHDDERLVSAEWRMQNEPGPEKRKLVLIWSGNGYGCQYELHRASMRETTKSVTVKVLVHRREMVDGEACAAVPAGGEAKVRLDRPLGDRKLKHARTNDPPASYP